MKRSKIKKIFSQALKIAIDNGHDTDPTSFDQIMYGLDYEPASEMIYIPIIFSHDFAKHFFGEKWKDNLQKMVLEEEPIKYIAKFIRENYNK